MNLLRRLLARIAEKFWVVPALLTGAGFIGAELLVHFDRSGRVPHWLIENEWVYTGGATGARTLLGAVASSTISVAGTVFSITIAALSLAAGQMGPRLLRNFTHDRGNQLTLGVFLGTFSYALIVLRSVRTASEGEFIPHVSLSVSLVLAFLSVATLIYFVGHMAGRINVDTVIELVSGDVRSTMDRLAVAQPGPAVPSDRSWVGGTRFTGLRQGYVQSIDREGLADRACELDVSIRLFVRPGDFVFPGATIAMVTPGTRDLADEIRAATSLGAERVSAEDLEFPVRQLVEVAVRALSPGINDPHTAISVLDRLGAALCQLVGRHLPSGVTCRDGHARLVVPAIDYGGLADAMFHMIRQNARGVAPIMIRMLEVLTAVADSEREADRLRTLQRHADLILSDAEHDIATPSDLADIRRRHARFVDMRTLGPASIAQGRSDVE